MKQAEIKEKVKKKSTSDEQKNFSKQNYTSEIQSNV